MMVLPKMGPRHARERFKTEAGEALLIDDERDVHPGTNAEAGFPGIQRRTRVAERETSASKRRPASSDGAANRTLSRRSASSTPACAANSDSSSHNAPCRIFGRRLTLGLQDEFIVNRPGFCGGSNS
ncbi:hypothetical protein [Burkholderia sp. BCC1640]|uniref:hypothetical protein n=1 Tax=Burkholderia sp. BCC1640 TaxID=2676294 RepID=UPI0015890E89|nr:hypothetical protein [Burkholderia sp. BCC1640]